ncbi:uncharacterized protein [Nothobranchius furzeri]|uniref:uncharacterized protein isoform X2 n=1 Tax=Nothobranchius furzeri TaxID=105023 RepID=UPI0039047E6C
MVSTGFSILGGFQRGKMHISVIDVGKELTACAIGTHFGCPLCPKVKPTSLKKIKLHFEGHINTALHFGENIICRCNMPCRSLAHYHCPYCCKTLLKKEQMERHVKLCNTTTTLNEVAPKWNPMLSVSTPERPSLHDNDYTLLALTLSDSTEFMANSDCAPSPPQLVFTAERSTSLPEFTTEMPPLQPESTREMPLLRDHDYCLLGLKSSHSTEVVANRDCAPSTPQLVFTPKKSASLPEFTPEFTPERPPLQPESTREMPLLLDHDYCLLGLKSSHSTEVVANSDCAPSSPQLVFTPKKSASLPEFTPERPPPLPESTPETPPLNDHDYCLLALTSSDSTEVEENSDCAPSPTQLLFTPERPPLQPESTREMPLLRDHDYCLLGLKSSDSTEVVANSDCAPSSPQCVFSPKKSASLPESTTETPPLNDHDYCLLALTSSDSTEVVENSDCAPSPTQLLFTPEKLTSLPESTPERPPIHGSKIFSSAKASRVKNLKMAKCPHCALVLYQKNLTLHIQRKHTYKKDITESFHLRNVCVDPVNGIFAVRKVSSHGFSTPVHVQRKTWGNQQQTKCELEECKQFHLLAQRSGLTHCLCEHIRSLDYCGKTAKEEILKTEVLEEMMSAHFFGAAMVENCKSRQKVAQGACVPLSVLVELGGSQRHICMSVHEPKMHYYSLLGRVIVTYNTENNTWHCPCSKPRTSCPHKGIAKWHLFQTRKHLFMTSTSTRETSEMSIILDCYSTEDLERSVRYIYEKKKIPAKIMDHTKVVEGPSDYPEKLFPAETCCQLCSSSPPLSDVYLVMETATIVGMRGVREDISTYNKRCSECNVVYRYQEWQDGLHNFNDKVILTLELCHYLRHNLQSHVSVSTSVTSLEKMHGKKYPPTDIIFRAYCHFEALNNTEYKYACVNCGFSPAVVIMDLHRKGVFSMAVSELKVPSEDFDGVHNIEDFWDAVHLDMISRAFFPKSSTNPFVVCPSYENWAPWIGKQTRKSDCVLNTEYKKIPLEKSVSDPELSNVTEDRLFDELLKQKVSTVRKLCETCKVDTKGSRLDLIKRLREKMQSRQTYDKVFQSIWGASGGWSVVLCPHGIVYSLKFNLRAESPRDFADILLSWKHFPNVCLYDFARGLASHTNLRTPENPRFHPNEGKLADPTKENLTDAARGKLKVCLPWLTEKARNPDKQGHPITGSNHHYALYDKFHEANTKDPHDILRKIGLVPELQGSVNSQVAEQLFAEMRKNNYFLNRMAPSTHIFLMRNLIEHRNNECNSKLLLRQLMRGHQIQNLEHFRVTDQGQAVIGDPDNMAKTDCQTVLDNSDDLKRKHEDVCGTQEEHTQPMQCGSHCEHLTKATFVHPNRGCWAFPIHPSQKEVLQYVLDHNKPGEELIVRTPKACLTRTDFLGLGLQRDMEATIGNGCLGIIEEVAKYKGRNIFICDLYVTPTWLSPDVDPMTSLPNDCHLKDAVFIPLWTPGHFLLCVIKPLQREILFLDSLYAKTESGFGALQYMAILRDVAQNLNPGKWTEKTGKDIKDLPRQDFGNDCGIFMLMAVLYIAFDAPFDYSTLDMPLLRKWWCLLLLENYSLDSYRKVFAHWTEECKVFLAGHHVPVFKLKKRKAEEPAEDNRGFKKWNPGSDFRW